MSVETIFSSKGRVKILKILADIGELNVSEIARRSGLNFASTNKHLRVLEESGIVRHKKFGRIRIFKFNTESERAKSIMDLIRAWNK
jgi:predicted transcriptional regulator